jgi:ribose transport system substrate-binding protein
MKRGWAMMIYVATIPALILLAACQKPYHQPDERYVFVTANIDLPYWQEAQAGLMDAAQVLGVKAEFKGPTSYAPEEELEAFKSAVASHPSGILLSATRPNLFKDAIDSAVQQGIPVICVDSDVPESHRIVFIGTDNVHAGMEGGRRLAEALHGQGHIVVITIPGQLNLDERLRGVNESLKKYPGIKIAATLDDKGDPRIANDQIAMLIQKKQNPDGILALEASGGPGAAEALNRLNFAGKIPVVAMDKDPETLDWITRGGITATIAQKPYEMSFYGLRFLDDLHHNVVHEFKDWRTAPSAPLPAWVDTGTAVVDASNVAAFQQALAAHPKPL